MEMLYSFQWTLSPARSSSLSFKLPSRYYYSGKVAMGHPFDLQRGHLSIGCAGRFPSYGAWLWSCMLSLAKLNSALFGIV
jgi:hypothetical protein